MEINKQFKDWYEIDHDICVKVASAVFLSLTLDKKNPGWFSVATVELDSTKLRQLLRCSAKHPWTGTYLFSMLS